MEQPKKLLVAHQNRIQVETDASILSNRIRLLKSKESKTWKAIELAEKRTERFLSIKELQETRQAEKQALRKERSEQLEQKRAKFASLREERNKTRWEIREGVKLFRSEKAREIKSISSRNELKIKDYLNNLTQKNERQERFVSSEKKRGKKRVQIYKSIQVDLGKKYYQDRICLEEKIQRQKEKEISEMAQVEMQLIEKFKNTEMIEKEVYETLEEVIRGPRSETMSSSLSPEYKSN